MNRICFILLYLLFLGQVHGAGQQQSIPDEDILADNQKVMNVLMRQLQREPDLEVRRTLILDHMDHMKTYTNNLIRIYKSSSDTTRQAKMASLYQDALLQSVSLLNSGLSDKDNAQKQDAKTAVYLQKFELRMQLLQSMMTQTTKLQALMSEPAPD